MRHTTARLDYLWLTACSDYFILFFKPINNCKLLYLTVMQMWVRMFGTSTGLNIRKLQSKNVVKHHTIRAHMPFPSAS